MCLPKQPSKIPSALLTHGVQNISRRSLCVLISFNNGLRCVPPAANQLANPGPIFTTQGRIFQPMPLPERPQQAVSRNATTLQMNWQTSAQRNPFTRSSIRIASWPNTHLRTLKKKTHTLYCFTAGREIQEVLPSSGFRVILDTSPCVKQVSGQVAKNAVTRTVVLLS